jgi:hypothetical protein
MPNSIAYTQNYTSILDAVYQRASVSGCLASGRRMVRAGRNAKVSGNPSWYRQSALLVPGVR